MVLMGRVRKVIHTINPSAEMVLDGPVNNVRNFYKELRTGRQGHWRRAKLENQEPRS